MAWTKINFYLSVLFGAVVLFSYLGVVGTDLLANDRVNMDEKSVDYLLELKGQNVESNFDDIYNKSAVETQKQGILDSEDDQQVSEDADFLSTLFIKKERAKEATNVFKTIYNLPTSILQGVGLNVPEFSHLINIITLFLFISIGIMIWTQIIRT